MYFIEGSSELPAIKCNQGETENGRIMVWAGEGVWLSESRMAAIKFSKLCNLAFKRGYNATASISKGKPPTGSFLELC